MCYDGLKSTESRIEENARAETEVNTLLVGCEHRTPVGLDSGIEYSATHRPVLSIHHNHGGGYSV